MPKTADKRARARHVARVARAHQTTIDHPVVRRTRANTSRRRPEGFSGFIVRYPWLTSIVGVLVVVAIIGIAYGNHLGPFARPAPHQTARHTPSCNLSTHVCDKPAMTIDMHKIYTATIKTAKGDIVFTMDPTAAPATVNNFVYLATQHFYDGLTFHRVEKSPASTLNIIQGGDPKGDGSGGPGYAFTDEPVVGDYTAGCVAMANSGPNTNGSQFFICTGDDTAALAKSYNLFGHVTSGLDVAQQIQPKDNIISITITSAPAPTPTPGK